MNCADRLRSLIVAGTGLVAGFVVWAVIRRAFGITVPPAFDSDPSWAVTAAGAAAVVAVFGYGIWRYGVVPLVAVRRARGTAAAGALVGRVFRVCWPFGLATGVVLAPLGADLPWGVDVMAFVALLWGWDWMKWASDARLIALLAEWNAATA